MKLKEQVDLIADYLENVLQSQGVQLDEAISDIPEGETLQGKAVTIDASVIVDIIDTLKGVSENLHFREVKEKLIDVYSSDLDKQIEIKKSVKAESDKHKAYQRAAKEMGWTDGTKKSDFELLVEYLRLIGTHCTDDGKSSPEIVKLYRSVDGELPPMDRIEAIESLAAKYPDPKRGKSNKQPRTNIYKRIQNAKKKLKAALKADGRPYKHLDKILPDYQEINVRDDEARDAYRYEDPEYDE